MERVSTPFPFKESYGVELYSYAAFSLYVNILGLYELTLTPVFLPLLIIPYAQTVSFNRPWIIDTTTTPKVTTR